MNLVALGQTKGTGATVTLLVRPQEAAAAIQALSQAYVDYYGALADSNWAQFRFYRALGQPAEYLVQEQHLPMVCTPALPPVPKVVAPVEETVPAQQPVPLEGMRARPPREPKPGGRLNSAWSNNLSMKAANCVAATTPAS